VVPVLHVPVRELRRQLEVDDHGVQRVVRIDLPGRDAGDLLELPDTGERISAEGDRPRLDVDPGGARVRDRGRGQEADREGCRGAEYPRAAPGKTMCPRPRGTASDSSHDARSFRWWPPAVERREASVISQCDQMEEPCRTSCATMLDVEHRGMGGAAR